MPSPEWINEKTVSCKFTPMTTHKFRGILLPGTVVTKSHTKDSELVVQAWENGLYHIDCRLLQFFTTQVLRVKEKQKGLRLEAVLSGELNIVGILGQKARLLQGQYHITDIPDYTLYFDKGAGCNYFVSYYTPELISDFGFEDQVKLSEPRAMPERMRQLIQETLHHPYQGTIKDLYYRKLVTELLYIHLTTAKTLLPDELTEADIAAVHQADAILSADLSEHYSITKLAGMAGTNAFKLKKGFRLLFKMGVFGRLTHQRMEQAKVLLETTSKPIKEVALEAGYETVAGFITAFRKRSGMTPLEWREYKSGKTAPGKNEE